MKAQIEVFKFTELQDKAREKARAWLEEAVTDYAWYDFLYDQWREELATLGWSDVEFHWSMDYSHYPGLAITGTLDLRVWIAARKRLEYYKAVSHAIESGSKKSTISLCLNRWPYPGLATILKGEDDPELRIDVMDDIVSFNRAYFSQLEEEYAYRVSEDALIEDAEANGYLFDRLGQPIHHLIAKPGHA